VFVLCVTAERAEKRRPLSANRVGDETRTRLGRQYHRRNDRRPDLKTGAVVRKSKRNRPISSINSEIKPNACRVQRKLYGIAISIFSRRIVRKSNRFGFFFSHPFESYATVAPCTQLLARVRDRRRVVVRRTIVIVTLFRAVGKEIRPREVARGSVYKRRLARPADRRWVRRFSSTPSKYADAWTGKHKPRTHVRIVNVRTIDINN